MQKITPHLWFDKEAKEAAEFYASLFPDSKITNVTTLHNTPSGDCDIVSFRLAGQAFMATSAGPVFKLNPSISFHVKCKTKEEVDALWEKLSQGGQVLMPLDKYPFSERYGWCNDRYGLSWQVIYVGDKPIAERIVPALMFVGSVAGRAEEAINFYASVFSAKGGSASGGNNSNAHILSRYGKGEEPDKEGTVRYADVILEGQRFGAMDSAHDHKFNFNEAISFIVNCKDQQEIDYYWDKLSAHPKSEQCGWLKDKFGVSWQIIPAAMGEMMSKGTPEQIARVTKSFLAMKKFNLDELEKAFNG